MLIETPSYVLRRCSLPGALALRRLSVYLLFHEPRRYLVGLELQVFCVDPSEQIEQARDETGPPRLVAGPEPRSVVAVEVLIEEDQIAPVRIVLKLGGPAVHRAPSPP